MQHFYATKLLPVKTSDTREKNIFSSILFAEYLVQVLQLDFKVKFILNLSFDLRI